MRYTTIRNVEFVTDTGEKQVIKDIRPINPMEYWFKIPVHEVPRLDEVSTRPRVFGYNNYTQVYKLFDFNVVQIVDGGFSLSRIKELEVPI